MALRILSKKKLRLGVRIQATFSPELEAAFQALSALVEQPEVLERLLQQAVAETLLASWRKRFLAGLPEAVAMERDAANIGPASGPDLDRARKALAAAAEELTAAQIEGRASAAAKRKVSKAEKALAKTLEPSGGTGSLATGQFRPLALQVLRVLSEISASTGGDSVSVGLGNRATLEAIQTPSATPMLTGHDTASSFNTLWKHLEFGTGVYASNKSWNSSAPTRTKSGGWWYGPRKGFGVQLKGSKGVHAVFDPASGVPYMADALRFEQVLEGLFRAALHGGR